MDSERYHLIKKLFQDALEHAPEDRAAFLAAKCGDDSHVRDEVVALLELDDCKGAAGDVAPRNGDIRADLSAASDTYSHKNSPKARDKPAARLDRRRLSLPTAATIVIVIGVVTYLVYQSADRTRQPMDIQPMTDAGVTSDTHRMASPRAGSTPSSTAAPNRLQSEPETHSDLLLAKEFEDLLNSMSHVNDTEPEARMRLADCRRTLGDAHPTTLLAMHYLARTLLRLNRDAESESLCEEAVRLGRQQLSAIHPFHLAAVAQHGRALIALGRYVDAERALLEAYEGYAETRGPGGERAHETAGMLSELYADWHSANPDQGHGDKSAHWRKKSSASSDLAASES